MHDFDILSNEFQLKTYPFDKTLLIVVFAKLTYKIIKICISIINTVILFI